MKYILAILILMLVLSFLFLSNKKKNTKKEYKSFQNKQTSIINPTIGLQQKPATIIKPASNEIPVYNKKLPHQLQKNSSDFTKKNFI